MLCRCRPSLLHQIQQLRPLKLQQSQAQQPSCRPVARAGPGAAPGPGPGPGPGAGQLPQPSQQVQSLQQSRCGSQTQPPSQPAARRMQRWQRTPGRHQMPSPRQWRRASSRQLWLAGSPQRRVQTTCSSSWASAARAQQAPAARRALRSPASPGAALLRTCSLAQRLCWNCVSRLPNRAAEPAAMQEGGPAADTAAAAGPAAQAAVGSHQAEPISGGPSSAGCPAEPGSDPAVSEARQQQGGGPSKVGCPTCCSSLLQQQHCWRNSLQSQSYSVPVLGCTPAASAACNLCPSMHARQPAGRCALPFVPVQAEHRCSAAGHASQPGPMGSSLPGGPQGRAPLPLARCVYRPSRGAGRHQPQTSASTPPAWVARAMQLSASVLQAKLRLPGPQAGGCARAAAILEAAKPRCLVPKSAAVEALQSALSRLMRGDDPALVRRGPAGSFTYGLRGWSPDSAEAQVTLQACTILILTWRSTSAASQMLRLPLCSCSCRAGKCSGAPPAACSSRFVSHALADCAGLS